MAEAGETGPDQAGPGSRRRRVAAVAAALLIALALVVVAVLLLSSDEDEILVLPDPAAQFDPPRLGDGVQVSGMVLAYEDAAKPQAEDELEEFADRNLIVAESIKVLDPPPPKITGGDPEEVLEGEGDDLRGEEVTVVGTVVGTGLPGRAFTIERPADLE